MEIQLVGKEKDDEIPYIIWSWVLPLKKRWNECKTEIKRVLTMQLRIDFYFVFDFECKCKQPTMHKNKNKRKEHNIKLCRIY